MLGLGFSEILVVLAIAFFIFGPERLPQVAQTLGKSMRELRQAADQMKQTALFPALEYETSFPDKANIEAGKQEQQHSAEPVTLPESAERPLTENNSRA